MSSGYLKIKIYNLSSNFFFIILILDSFKYNFVLQIKSNVCFITTYSQRNNKLLICLRMLINKLALVCKKN